MVTTDCHPVGSAMPSSPPAPVVGASTRVSRLHTRYILRPELGGAFWLGGPEPAAEEVPAGEQPEPAGEHDVGGRHEAEHGGEPGQQYPPVPAQAVPVGRDAMARPGPPGEVEVAGDDRGQQREDDRQPDVAG